MAARLHHVKKARKDNPVCKKGESYYWWEFPFSGKRYSKDKPRRSALTQSSYYSQIWDIQDDVEGACEDFDTIEGDINDYVSRLEEVRDECEASFDNMPESLQDADTGQLLQERIDSVQSAIDELEAIEIPTEDDFEGDGNVALGEWKEERRLEVRQEMEDAVNNIE